MTNVINFSIEKLRKSTRKLNENFEFAQDFEDTLNTIIDEHIRELTTEELALLLKIDIERRENIINSMMKKFELIKKSNLKNYLD